MTTELTVPEETNISTVGGFDLVDPEGAAAYWKNYEEVVAAILTDEDYQGQQFKKKSAYRKLATAFNFDDEIIKEETKHDEKGRVLTSKFYVKAIAPNGRYSVGVGSCSLYDKINKKDKTEPTEFELRKRFNNPDHDIVSTAHTRAKNRAIADLIGTGEVSAEEIEIIKGDKDAKENAPKRSKKSKTSQKRQRKSAPAETAEPAAEEVIEAEVIDTKSDNPAVVLKGTDNVVLGEWFRKIIQKLEARGEQLTMKNFERIAKIWSYDNQYPDFTPELKEELLNNVGEV